MTGLAIAAVAIFAAAGLIKATLFLWLLYDDREFRQKVVTYRRRK
jgi:hypothetical protein